MDLSKEHTVKPSELSEVPRRPGIYIFEGRLHPQAEELTALYVGKARDLRNRVRQYFNDTDKRPFVEFIRAKAEQIRYVVVDTEQDALLLENEFIKRLRPPYNILLKDDTRYLSLRLDLKHEWPKIDVVRKIKRDKAVYLGPFSSAHRLRMTLDFMQKIFLLRTCNDHKLYNRSRPCIEYDLKRCSAPCVNYISKDEYHQIVRAAVMFLKGKNKDLLTELKSEMKTAAEREDFERAAVLRDRIDAIEATTEGQGIIGLQQLKQGLDQDAIGIAWENSLVFVNLLFVRSGVIFDQRTFEFRSVKLDPQTFLLEFLEQYYSGEVYRPQEILIPFEIPSAALELDAKVFVPKAGEKKKFLEIAENNAQVRLQSKIQKSQKLSKTLESLQRKLGLKTFPAVMDCMDISHHQGAETVASVVRFSEGLPDKNGYRRLKLSKDQVNDFESMREVVSRRYKEKADLPNLLVIDGGPGQLSSALGVLTEKGWQDDLDLVSLAKARESEGVDPLNPQNRERIFKPHQKNPILLQGDSAEELLMRYLRDEAHRFAITYHRHRKEESISASLLDEIPGLTARLKLKLLRRFGSVEGILEAAKSSSDEELLKEIPAKLVGPLKTFLLEAVGEKQ